MSRPRPVALDPPTDDMSRLLDVVAGVVLDVSDGRGLGRVTPGVSFELGLGLASLERVELVVRACDAFGVRPPEEGLHAADTPAQLLSALIAEREGSPPAPMSDRASSPPVSAAGPERSPASEPIEVSTLVEVLEHRAIHQPDRAHLILWDDADRARAVTHRELHRAALGVARSLRRRGIEPGWRVAIMLPTGLGFFASFMGIVLAGAVPMPLPFPAQLDRIDESLVRHHRAVDEAGARALVTFERAARAARSLRERLRPIQRVISVQSLLHEEAEEGTSSDRAEEGDPDASARVGIDDPALVRCVPDADRPTPVELTQGDLLAEIHRAARDCALEPRDTVVCGLPLDRPMGLVAGWLMPLCRGVPTVSLSPEVFAARPARWLQAITRHGSVCAVVSGAALDLHVGDEGLDGIDLRHVRVMLDDPEPLPPMAFERIVNRLGRVGLRRHAVVRVSARRDAEARRDPIARRAHAPSSSPEREPPPTGPLARLGEHVRRLGRATYGVYAGVTLSSLCIFAGVFGRVVPRGAASRRVASLEARLAMGLAGLRPRVIGLDRIPEGPVIVVINHAGYLDFLVCTAALPHDLRFVIKQELHRNRFAGPLLRRQEHTFIDRHTTARSLADLEKIAGLLREGQRLIVFPEGTFHPEVGMRVFKLGAFWLAGKAGVPVVPVAIRGSRRVLRDGTWLPRYHPIEIEVLEPMWARGNTMADRVELRDRCAQAIAARIDEPWLHAADIRVHDREVHDT